MIFETLDTSGHEQVVFCHNPDAGLKAIIALDHGGKTPHASYADWLGEAEALAWNAHWTQIGLDTLDTLAQALLADILQCFAHAEAVRQGGEVMPRHMQDGQVQVLLSRHGGLSVTQVLTRRVHHRCVQAFVLNQSLIAAVALAQNQGIFAARAARCKDSSCPSPTLPLYVCPPKP